jgi:amino acid adenylation domain-containing protein/thioester reductase-like protein
MQLTQSESLSLLLHKFAPTRSRFRVVCYAVTSIDEGRLRRAIQHLFTSQANLRAVLVEDDDQVVTKAYNDAAMMTGLEVMDLGQASLDRLRVEQWIDELNAAIADADQAVHLRLWRQHDGTLYLAIAADQVFIDARSFAALPQKLLDCYQADGAGPSAVAPSSPGDPSSPDTAAAVDYWTSKLGDHTFSMPQVRVERPTLPATEVVEFEPGLSATFYSLADKYGVDPVTVLHSGLQLFLGAYAESHDVIFGYALEPEVGETAGSVLGNEIDFDLFRSTLPWDRDFGELLHSNRAQRQNDQYFRLPVLEVTTGLRRRYKRHITTTNVVVEPRATPPPHLGDGSVPMQWRPDLYMPCVVDDLTIWYDLEPQAIRLTLVADRSAAGYLPMMGLGLKAVFEQVLKQPQVPIDGLALVTPVVEQRLMGSLNQPAVTIPASSRTLHGVIEQWAQTQPDAIAVRDAHQDLTYRQLNERTNQLARLLRSFQTGPTQEPLIVSVLMHRSAWIVAVVIAILKAGGTYVVIDDEYPQSRIDYIIGDSGSQLVVTDSENLSRLTDLEASFTAINIHDLGLQQQLREQGSTNLDLAVEPSDLAYIIYTSGTTGRPKGIQIPHRNVLNLFAGCRDRFHTDPDSRHGHLNSFSFDATVIGLWFSLLSGGELMVLDREEFMTPAALANAIHQYHLTHAFVPNALVNSYGLEAPETFANLKLLSFGGEKPNYASLMRIHRRCVGLRQLNVYGPSEITVMCTADIVDPTRPYSDKVPIGQPLPNYACYVVDANGHLQLPGAPGELWVSGPGLARGYVGLPEKTAAVFVANLFQDRTPAPIAATERCYRTGDRARWLPDGRLEFLGRIDTQVKIRGFRIELDEVTEAIRRSPDVANAVVVATVLPGAQEKDLVAFVISTRRHPNESAFRESLEEILPHYMIPRRIVFVDDFPFTTSGKFDTKALVASLQGEDSQAQATTVGMTDQERQLQQILIDVVGNYAMLQADDDIFSLGIHSLIVSRFVSRIQKQMDVPLSLREVTEARTLTQISRVIDQLRAADRHRQFEFVRNTEGGTSGPAGYLQEVFWLISAKENDASANVAMAIHLRGEVDVLALARAMERLVNRHDSFRTTYHFDGDTLLQYVHESITPPLQVIDLTAEGLETRVSQLQGILHSHRTQVFDLAVGPLFAVSLVPLERGETLLVLSIHHSIFDGSSLEVFFRDLGAFYEAEVYGTPVSLPPIEATYLDYATSQRAWIKNGTLDDPLAYWRAHIAEMATERVTIPGAAKSQPDDSAETLVIKRSILPRHLERADQLIALLGSNRFTFFCSLYLLCLQRLSQQDDMNLSMIVADRRHAELDPVIGCFVNSPFITKKLHPLEIVRDYLLEVHRAAMEMLDNQDIPRLVLNDMVPAEALGALSLAYAYESGLAFGGELTPDIQYTIEELYPGPVDDASLIMQDSPEGLMAHFRFNPGFVDPTSAEVLVNAFLTLLTLVPDRLEDYAVKIPVVSPAEAADLVGRSQATRIPDRHDTMIGQIVDQMAQTPDRLAVGDRNGALTYGQLDRATGTMAAALCDRMASLDPDGQLIALCISRSVETVRTILAIMRAGYGYVSLDPAQPIDRLRYIAERSGVKLIVAEAEHHAKFDGLNVVLLTPEQVVQGDSEALRGHRSFPAQIAWVIFTSGTTGRPKGVEISQRSAGRFVRAFKERYGLTETDVFTACHSYSFDYSTIENFMALTTGGQVYVVDFHTIADPVALVEVIESQKVTVFSQTPAAFQNTIEVLKEQGGLQHWPRYVNLGGENLVIDNLSGWFDLPGYDHTQIMNIYGITETTCMSCSYPVTPADLGVHRFTPIGKPFPDQSFYLLDNHLNPVPDGFIGELYIGGAGLADGYLGQLAMTRQRFLMDPFTDTADAFMYRSGDLVIRDGDGVFHYVGRTDSQLNLRGIRIELGEIESVLSSHPAINKCFITDFTPASGEQMIVAYWTPEEGYAPDDDLENSFKRHLEVLLPAYMVPSRFVGLPALPLTWSGKIDKKALPSPLQTEDRIIVSPGNDTQRHIAQIWSDILHRPVDDISIDDNFYEIGGNSLLLARMLFRLRKDLPDLELDQAQVQKTPTIQFMAGDQADSAPVDTVAITLQDCALPPQFPATVQPAPPDRLATPQNILVTGTTGFLGSHLVAELLHTTDATIHCAVRGSDPAQRQRQVLSRLALLPSGNDFEARLRFVPCDLAQPKLGVDAATWSSLADTIDLIIHCGAFVHHVFDYPMLRDANVGSTQALLELAASGTRAKAITLVSTTSAASVVVDHDFPEVGPGPQPLLTSGYPLTKYVAERLVAEFQQRGGTAAVVRPGNISADTRTGITVPELNHVLLLIKGSVQLGLGPTTISGDAYIDISPVNQVAAATCALARDPLAQGRTWHLSNPHRVTWTNIWDSLRSLGYVIQTVDYNTWATRVQEVDESNALFALAAQHQPGETEELYTFDTTATTQRLAALGTAFTPTDPQTLERMMRWLMSVGFLPEPANLGPSDLAATERP